MPPSEAGVELRGVTFAYTGAAAPALADINLTLPAGQFCGVVGANGAGKTTLCYLLAGFMPQFYSGELQGMARVAGYDVLKRSPGEVAGDVGLLFQNPFNQITGARFTVREEIAFGLENLGVPREQMEARIAAAMAIAGLEGLDERSPYALSGGQQQRLALASVLVMRPKILVLDEPTSQLDPVGTRETFAALDRLTRDQQTTIVLTEHKLEWLAAYADRVVALANGRIVADGPPRQVLGAPGIGRFEISATRYTQAAGEARGRGLASRPDPLPVTMEQAVEFFR